MCFFSVVLSSVVCEIGSSGTKAKWGQVEVEVNGGKKGISSLVFTYRVSTLPYSHTNFFFLLSWTYGGVQQLLTQENETPKKLSADFVCFWSLLCSHFLTPESQLSEHTKGMLFMWKVQTQHPNLLVNAALRRRYITMVMHRTISQKVYAVLFNQMPCTGPPFLSHTLTGYSVAI